MSGGYDYSVADLADIKSLMRTSPRDLATIISAGQIKTRFNGSPDKVVAIQMMRAVANQMGGNACINDQSRATKIFTQLVEETIIIYNSDQMDNKEKNELFNDWEVIQRLCYLMAQASLSEQKKRQECIDMGAFTPDDWETTKEYQIEVSKKIKETADEYTSNVDEAKSWLDRQSSKVNFKKSSPE